MEFVVRLKGKQEHILKDFVEKGYYNTKSEVIRAGLLELAQKHNLEPSLEEVILVRKAIKNEFNKIKNNKEKTISEKQFLKKYSYLEDL